MATELRLLVLLVRIRETLSALWDCTCNPGLLGDEREENRCERCDTLAQLDTAIERL